MGEQRRFDVDAIIGLLWLAWGLGTPYCLYAAAISAASFFGEAPTEAEISQSHQFLFAGLACGLLVPVIGMLLAGRLRRRCLAWAFGVALALTVTGLSYVLASY